MKQTDVDKAPGASGSTADVSAQSKSSEPAPGHTLAGRFILRKKVSESEFGRIFRVYDSKRDRDNSIRVITPELVSNDAATDCFDRESKIVSEFYHPAIVKVMGWRNEDDCCFQVMELLKGQTLRQLIRRRKKAGKPFSESEVIAIGKSLGSGISYAHRKTNHLDLRPENIWIDDQQNAKLMGFGHAALRRINQLPYSSSAPTTAYLAPEQLVEGESVNAQADQYALGLILHELFTFEVPTPGNKSIRVHHRNISSKMTSILERMLKFKADDRYYSMEQFVDALTTIKSGRTPISISRKALSMIAISIIIVALIVFGVTSGKFAQLWQTFQLQTVDSDVQFNQAITLVSDINEAIKSLNQARNQLESRIRDGDRDIRAMETRLRQNHNQSVQTEVKQQLVLARVDQMQYRQLKNFSESMVFGNDVIFRSESAVLSGLSLMEVQQHSKAIAVLRPVLVELERAQSNFANADGYLQARQNMLQSQARWLAFSQAQQLQQPAKTQAMQQRMVASELLAEQGQLDLAIKQVEQLNRDFDRLYLGGQQLIIDRASYQSQHAITQKLERDWLGYLKRNRLTVNEQQAQLLQRGKSEVQTQVYRQQFSSAAKSSRLLAEVLEKFDADARANVAANNQQRIAASAKQAEIKQKLPVATVKAPVTPKPVVENPRPEAAKSTAVELPDIAPGMKLIRIPSASFNMGSLSRGGSNDEKPVHRVTLKAFNLSQHEVTFAQYDRYARLTGIAQPDDEGWGRGNRPVINVNWNEAVDYANWLSEKTGLKFRLPSEAEWEYAARAGSTTAFSWGDEASHAHANYGKDNCCGGLAAGADEWQNTSPAGSFPANRFGAFDMHGNVSEWVQDCSNRSYNGAPVNGSAWLRGDCNKRVLRGGSWSSVPDYLRSANRDASRLNRRSNSVGFRLVQQP